MSTDSTLPPLAPGQAVWVWSAEYGADECVIHSASFFGGVLDEYRVANFDGDTTLERPCNVYRNPEDADALKARVMAQAAVLVDFAESLPCAAEGETGDE